MYTFCTCIFSDSTSLYQYGQSKYKYPVLGRDKSYFVIEKNHSDSTKKFSEADYIQILEFLIDNFFGGRVFQHCQHSYGYKLCSSSHQYVPLFVRDRLHTGASQENRKEARPIF